MQNLHNKNEWKNKQDKNKIKNPDIMTQETSKIPLYLAINGLRWVLSFRVVCFPRETPL